MESDVPQTKVLRSRQLALFTLSNALSERFGSEFFRELPESPGVYFFYDADGLLLYVGQSHHLRNRISSYRHVNSERHPKRTTRLIARVKKIEWLVCESAECAIAKESELLLELKPPFNRAGVWQGDPWWLNLDATAANRLSFALTREEGNIGPLPPAFRYAFGTLIRSVYRLAYPELPIAAFPHGLFGPRVPLSMTLTLPDGAAAERDIAAYAQGMTEDFLMKLETLPMSGSAQEQEYWLEEIESLKRYAAKSRKAVFSTTADEESMRRNRPAFIELNL